MQKPFSSYQRFLACSAVSFETRTCLLLIPQRDKGQLVIELGPDIECISYCLLHFESLVKCKTYGVSLQAVWGHFVLGLALSRHGPRGARTCGPEPKQAKADSSSREVRIRVPFCMWSILRGEPPPKKRAEKGHLAGGPRKGTLGFHTNSWLASLAIDGSLPKRRSSQLLALPRSSKA